MPRKLIAKPSPPQQPRTITCRPADNPQKYFKKVALFERPVSWCFQPHFHHNPTTIYHPFTTFCTPKNPKPPAKKPSTTPKKNLTKLPTREAGDQSGDG